MKRTFTSPSKYYQGPGELNHLGGYAAEFGSKALVLISGSGKKRFGSAIEGGFAETKAACVFELFSGECCREEIEKVREAIRKEQADVLVGVGGGKALDTAKAASFFERIPLIIVPTIAATDAPTSALSVINTKEGAFESAQPIAKNPDMVVVDSKVIADAPIRFTVSGIGDALSTWFEARANDRRGGNNSAGGKPTRAGLALAELCCSILMEEGVAAVEDLKRGALTPSVEAVIEANILLSGIGFESGGGLAVAHALNVGLDALPECSSCFHGEKVAFGTIVQLVLERAPEEELAKVLELCVAVGLPVTMKQLGVEELTVEKADAVAKLACEDEIVGNMPFEVTVEMMREAILAADSIGREVLAQ